MFFEYKDPPNIDWPELFAFETFVGIDEYGEVVYDQLYPVMDDAIKEEEERMRRMRHARWP